MLSLNTFKISRWHPTTLLCRSPLGRAYMRVDGTSSAPERRSTRVLVLQRKRAIRHVPRAPDTPPRYKPNTHSLSHTPLDFDSGMPHARLHSTLPHFHTPSRLSTSAHHHTHPHTHYTPSSHHTPHTEGDSAIHAVLRSASLSPQPHAHQMFTSHTHSRRFEGGSEGIKGEEGEGGDNWRCVESSIHPCCARPRHRRGEAP